MKVLIYTASSLCNPQFGIQMEKAIEYSKKGNEVVFCYCSSLMKACSANPYANKSFCDACKIGFKAGLKNLPKNVRIEKLPIISQKALPTPMIFKSISEIKRYQYKNVNVGFSVLSVYISKTRNPNPIINEQFLKCINALLSEAEKLVDSAESIIQKECPDLIVFFNGRYFDTKPFYDLAVNKHIDFVSTENVGGIRADSEYKMVEYLNRIPHDAHLINENCLASWNQSSKTEEEKTDIGISFFERRRDGQRAGDYAYTANQEKGLLPLGFDINKKNVVIYCSSEDEYSSVSPEIDSYYLFKSQYEAIRYLAENINDNQYHFYVRIHPNMRGLDVGYHKDLYKLESFDNVTVIAPENPVSSYSLMDSSYNIVVFGSTIGAESLFWEKSVVLLGFSGYYHMNCCLIPHDYSDFLEFVKNPKVFQGARTVAIKYGFYLLENSLSKKTNYLDITPKKKTILGHTHYFFSYLSICGSPVCYRVIHVLFTRIFVLFHKNRICYPDKFLK